MSFWQMLLIQVLATGAIVALVMAVFHGLVLKPYLDRKVKELNTTAEGLEPRIAQGVKNGLGEALRELPESTVRESRKQIMRFGTDLVENGLSSFLGTSADLERRSRSLETESGGPAHRR